MKTIKLQLLILLIPISINLCAQDMQRFAGVYHLEGMCEDMLHAGSEFPDERDVIITEGTESDLLINIGESAGSNDFKAFVSNDSLSVPLQWWENFDETQASFQAKGKVENDSLFLHYKAGGTFGGFDCKCKGKKVGTVDVLYPTAFDKNKVYVDVTNQIIVISNTLQDQPLTFELINTEGKVILKRTNAEGSYINIANLPNGVYLYRLLQNNQIIYGGKIVK